MALYQNGILISGANKLPQMTYAEWQALPAAERPSEWICTDRSYSDLPASDVTYDNTDSGLSADNIQDAIDEVAQSSGSGGHVIQDSSGTDMPQRANMQFADSHVSDDSTNDKTVIENIKSVASADYSSETEDRLYLIPDGDGSVIEPASEDYVEVTADGNKTLKALLQDLYDAMDRTKLLDTAYVKRWTWSGGYSEYRLIYGENTFFRFTNIAVDGTYAAVVLGSNNRSGCFINGTEDTTTKPDNGLAIRLYYGNKKAVVDLQTTANRCWYDNNTTVKQKIDEKTSIGVINITGIYLNDLTWSQDSTGKYYALIQRVTSIGNGILISAIITEFSRLKASDVIQLYWLPGTSDIKVMSNVNSFTTNAQISIRLAYVKE